MMEAEPTPSPLQTQALRWRRASCDRQIAELAAGGPIPSRRRRPPATSLRTVFLGTTGQWATLVALPVRLGGMA